MLRRIWGKFTVEDWLPRTIEKYRNIYHYYHDELRSSFGKTRKQAAICRGTSGSLETIMQIAGTLRETSKPSYKLQEHFGKPRNRLANCRGISGNPDTFLQIAELLREVPKLCRKAWTDIWNKILWKSKRLTYSVCTITNISSRRTTSSNTITDAAARNTSLIVFILRE